ncbi:MAG: ABC transporter substrate-binding protein, partial [Ardenticatenaceae bacterium]
QEMGLKEEVQFVCLNYCAYELLIQQAGDATEGVVGSILFAPPSTGAEGVQVALDYAEANNIDLGGNEIPFVQGWWAMAILVEGIENTVEAGQELTGPNIKASLEALEGFETGGVTVPISFSPDDHRGNRQLKLYRVENGEWVPITDFIAAE